MQNNDPNALLTLGDFAPGQLSRRYDDLLVVPEPPLVAQEVIEVLSESPDMIVISDPFGNLIFKAIPIN